MPIYSNLPEGFYPRPSDVDAPLRSPIGIGPRGPKGHSITAEVIDTDPYGYFRVQFKDAETDEVLVTTPNLDVGSRFFVCDKLFEDVSVGSQQSAVNTQFSNLQASSDRSAIRVGDLVFFTTRTSDETFLTLDTIGIGVVNSVNGTNVSFITTNVMSARVADGGITTDMLADFCVTAAKLADNAVTTRSIANLNVTEDKLAPSAVTTDKIGNNAVTTAKVDNEAITGPKLGPSSVTTSKIADGNITPPKFSPETNSYLNELAEQEVYEYLEDHPERVTPSDAQAEAVITEWLDDHPEATTTVQDGSITDVKVNAASGIMRYLANISSGDLDTFVVPNKAYLCLGTSVANRPNNKIGLLVVLGAQPTNGAYMQLYMTRDNEMFTRTKYGNLDWTAWAEMPSKANVMSYVFGDANISPTSSVMRYLPNISSGDFDDYSVCNKTYLVLGTSVTHQPASKPGLLVVLGAQPTNGAYMQLYVTRDNEMFIRSKYGNLGWTTWTEMLTETSVMSCVFSDNNISATSGIMRYLANLSSGDFDDYVVPNKSYLVTGTSLAHQPIAEPGLLVVLGAQPTNGAYAQTFISRSGQIFNRLKYGPLDWTEWSVSVSELYVRQQINLSRATNILSAFSNITCCGDSLTFSQVYTGSTTYRQAYVTYPQTLQKLSGTPTTAYAVFGYDAIDWWEDFASDIVTKPNQLAIIYLGTNHGLTDTLATDCPTGTPYTQWADTNTGCYGKIVAKFKEAGARVALIKCYATSGSDTSDLATTNDVITQIGSRFGCAVVDNYRLTDDKYHNYPDLSGLNLVHYNDLGYAAFASYLIYQLGHLSDSQMSLLIPS